MIYTLKSSQSLIGNLAKESYRLRTRSLTIIESIKNCKDTSLVYRLKRELDSLEKQRSKNLEIAKSIIINGIKDKLSIELLIEICKRPLQLIN